MNAEITFNCSKCRKAITMRPDIRRPHIACPHCGAMNHLSAKKMRPHRFGLAALAIVLVPAALATICWSLTITMGADSLRPEIVQLSRGRKNARVTIKAPAPFVLTYTITLSSKGGSGQASMTIRKYCYWFITTKREIPESDVPELFKRVWP